MKNQQSSELKQENSSSLIYQFIGIIFIITQTLFIIIGMSWDFLLLTIEYIGSFLYSLYTVSMEYYLTIALGLIILALRHHKPNLIDYFESLS